jgi:hypothetical protein
MVLIHQIIVQVLAQLLQGEDHVVDLHAIDQLRIVSQLCLNSIELGIKLL